MRKLIKIKFIPEILTMIRQTYKIIEWLLVSLKLRNNNNKMKKRKKISLNDLNLRIWSNMNKKFKRNINYKEK